MTGVHAPPPAGHTASATWALLPAPTDADWLGLFAPGAPDSPSLIPAMSLNGQAAGQVAVPIPPSLAPGTYELRLFSGATRLVSSTLEVMAAN